MVANWVEEALKIQQHAPAAPLTLTPPTPRLELPAPIAERRRVRGARRRWLLALGLSIELLIGVSLPGQTFPFLPWGATGEARASTPGYALYQSGQATLPAGIRELRVVGRVGVVTISGKWAELGDAERIAALETLQAGLADLEALSVFQPDGRLAAIVDGGRVEVLP